MIRAVLGLAFLGLVSGIALAQDAPEVRSPAEDHSSPRATMMAFLNALNPPEGAPVMPEAAASCLDYSKIDAKIRDEVRVELARRLKMVIDRIALIEPDDLPGLDYEGTTYVWSRRRSGSIAFEKTPDGAWLFSAATVASIDDLWEEVRLLEPVAGRRQIGFGESPPLWFRSKMPRALLETGFLLEHWQWVALLILCVLGIVVERLVNAAIPSWLTRRLRKKQLEVDADTAKVGLRPFGILAMALLWWALLPWVGLPVAVYLVLVVAIRFLSAAAGVWAAYRLVDVFADVLARKAKATDTKFDDLLVPLFRKSLKVFITVVGLVFLASVLRINVTSVLAGLGIGTLAFTLAAQDSVKNLFGSLTVIFDRPFQVGDWVKVGDREGTVEEVGFRSTRLRTFYNSLVTIPNGNLITAVVDNMGARRYRRLKTVLSLTYDTPPEKIEAFCEGVRELIRRHPYTRKDYYHVYLNAFAGSSVDVLLYMFFEVPDWGTELRERHRMLSDVLRLAARLGVEFAFPTRTVWLNRTEGEAGPPDLPDEAVVREAADRGREEARGIVEGTLGGSGAKPPPATFGISEREDRGEDDAGDGGE